MEFRMADTTVYEILKESVLPGIREQLDRLPTVAGETAASAWTERMDGWLSTLSNPQLWKQPVTATEDQLTAMAAEIRALDNQDPALFREALQQLVLQLQVSLLGETVVRSRVRTVSLKVIDCLVRTKRHMTTRLQDKQVNGSLTLDHPEVLPAMQELSPRMQRYQNALWAQAVEARLTQLENLEALEMALALPMPPPSFLDKLRLLSLYIDQYLQEPAEDDWLLPVC